MHSLDTHATIRELEAAGVETRQAEAIVSAISRADEQAATKADVARLDARLNVLQWVVGVQSAVILAIALRVFGLI